MQVGDLEQLLNKFDSELEVVFVEHPYRGSTAVLDVGEYDVIECDDPDAPGIILDDDEDPTKPVLVINVHAHADDYTPADGERWPGRS